LQYDEDLADKISEYKQWYDELKTENLDLSRKKLEGKLVYRVCSDKNIIGSWDDVTYILNVLQNEKYTESKYRKQYGELKKKPLTDEYELSKDDIPLKEIQKPKDNDYLQEIQKQKDELYKIKRQISDQRREYNKLLILDARSEHLMEEMIGVAKKLNDEMPLNFSNYISCVSKKEAALFCADWHYGMTTDNIWNQFNTSICKDRVIYLTNQVKEFVLLNKVNTIHLVLLGDMAHGAIHTSARVASEEDTCDQIMHVSEILAQMINEISSSVNKVKVYSCYGNHLRTIQNKKESVHSDNMEKMIPWWLNWRLKENTKVSIIESEFKEFTKLNILGSNICCVHGDLDNIKKLGTDVNTLFTKLYGETIDYAISADKHHLEEFESFGIENILVRSLCGTDDHANGKRLYSTAGQSLMIFNDGCGRECTYNIKFT